LEKIGGEISGKKKKKGSDEVEKLSRWLWI